MHRDDYDDILQQLIAFPTVSAESNLPLIDYLQSLLDDHGFRTKRRYNDEGSKANLLARIGPQLSGGIALAGHTDVVPVSGQDPEPIHQELQRLSERIRADMPGISVDTRIVAGVPGLQAGANCEIVSELRRFIEPPEPAVTAVPFVTEGGLFQEAGIPAVICGPGLLEQAHQPNEWVSVDAMNEYGTFLAQVVGHGTQA
jgi:acetylornithine deacetylase/succinyl-diaminopimelate desuccinylase-like protein